jgi:protoporphyrinogen/coproporphyrinogen III oxidase
MPVPRAIIVGGGITGLSAAYEFAQAGQPAILLETRPRLGGVIETERVEGCVLEGGPDSFLAAKPAGLDLIREVGLGSELIGSNDKSRVTYLVRGGRLVPMPDGLMMMVPTKILPLVASPILGWGTKFRMGLEYFRRPPTDEIPDRSVADFISDHYGRETVDYLAEPLLSGVYGGSVDRLSVNSVLTRFVELERQYGSLTRGVLTAKRKHATTALNGTALNGPASLFQTLKGGLAQLTGELESRIRDKIQIWQATAESVEATGQGFRVRAGGESLEASSVILATPAWAAGALLRDLDHRLAGLLEGVEYSSSATVAIGFRRSDCGAIPPGFGFLVPACERRMLVACTFVGAKFPFRVPDEIVVMRCFVGGAGQEAMLQLDDSEILRRVMGELQSLLGWTTQPLFTRIARWHRAMAQYTVGHGARLAWIRERLESLPGLYLAGNAYEGIGVPDCIRTGRRAASQALARQPG